MKQQAIIFFDSQCVLCENSVQFILQYEKKPYFHFAALNSLSAKAFKLHQAKINSVVLIENKTIYYKSDAVLRIAKQLKFPINLLSVFIFLPQTIRHFFYDIIANNRYKWFEKKENCFIPLAKHKKRFL